MIGIFFALLYFEDLSVAPSLSRLFFEKYILILLLCCSYFFLRSDNRYVRKLRLPKHERKK